MAPLNGIEWYCGPLSGVPSGIEVLFPGIWSGIRGLLQRQALNGIVALLLGFWVVFKALFPGIQSGIQGLNGIDRPEWYLALLNGIEWYCGPLSGVPSAIEVLFPGIWSGIRGLLQRQALNGIVALLLDFEWYSRRSFLWFKAVFRAWMVLTGPEWYLAPLNGIEWYCGPLSGVSSGIEVLFSWDLVFRDTGPEWYYGLFLGFWVVFKALCPGILSGIQGLNGIDRPWMVLWPPISGIKRYCGPLSGVASGIEVLFPGIWSGIKGLLQRQALNGIMALFLGFAVVFKALFPGILSDVQGLTGIDLNGIVAPKRYWQALNGIVALFLGFRVVLRSFFLGFEVVLRDSCRDMPWMVLWPFFWDFQWSLSWDSKRYSGPEWYWPEWYCGHPEWYWQALNGIVALFLGFRVVLRAFFLGFEVVFRASCRDRPWIVLWPSFLRVQLVCTASFLGFEVVFRMVLFPPIDCLWKEVGWFRSCGRPTHWKGEGGVALAFPGGVAPKFGSEKVSRYTGVSQLQLRVSRYTVQLSSVPAEPPYLQLY